MRYLLYAGCLLLAACDPLGGAVFSGASLASITMLQRTVPDLAVSILSGRDCSIVHVDADAPYCSPREAAPVAPPHCTRSLGGGSDCWATETPPPGREVADQAQLTATQEQNRQAGWFGKWIGF